MTKKFNPIILVKDDNLHIDEVGEWGESKYKIVGNYCNLFTSAMHNKWPRLVYLDLFSGCGYSRIKNSDKIVLGSPLISLSIQKLFTDYIFVEYDKNKYEALSNRIHRMNLEGPNINLLNGDSNDIIDTIIPMIPKDSLSFCFIDPYNIKINFEVIKKLTMKFKIDFLVLLAFGMDAKRNYKIYCEESDNRIELLTNNKGWRVDFSTNYKPTNNEFIRFIADNFSKNMIDIGYVEPSDFESIRSIINNLPLYHLAFFSKKPLGNKFWDEVKKCSTEQYGLF